MVTYQLPVTERSLNHQWVKVKLMAMLMALFHGMQFPQCSIVCDRKITVKLIATQKELLADLLQ